MLPGELFGEILEVEYAWEGPAHESPSAKRVHGVEVARNRMGNPSFEQGSTGWVAGNSGVDVTTVARSGWLGWDNSGTRMLRISPNANAGSGVYVRNTGAMAVDVTPGDWVAIRGNVAVRNPNDVTVRFTGQITVNGNSFGPMIPASFESVAADGETRVVVGQMPAGASAVRVVPWMMANGVHFLSNDALFVDAVVVAVASTESEALAQVGQYFDGDTPNVYRVQDGNVRAFASRVTVNGVDRPAVSVDLDAAWRSDLPSQISAGGSSMSRDGTVEWATEHDVHERPVTAFRDWGVWRPQKGDRIIIYAGDGINEWPRFTGVVDETTGAVGTGMRSTIIADVDPLSEDFECEPLLDRMYPLPGSSSWRWAGLSPMFFVDAAMRAGGYHVTTPTPPWAAVHVPLQSSMLPAPGTNAELLSGDGYTGSSRFQENWGAPWGLSSGNFHATYRPVFQRTPNQAVQISMMATEAHTDLGYVTAHYGGTTNFYRLIVGSTRSAYLQQMRNGTLTEIVRLSSAQMVGATRVEVLIKNGQAVLRNNNGAMSAGSVPGLANNPMSRVDITAQEGARIAGVSVSHPEPWQEFQYLNFKNTARIRTHAGNTATWGIINASPRYARRAALSMLEEMADQTLSAMWIDEEGVLQFAPSNGIRNTPSEQTITTADDVLALSWSDRLLAVAKRVTVEYLHPYFKSGTSQAVEVARGSKQTLHRGDVIEDVYSPGGDEDWYGVDTNPMKLPEFGWSEYNGAPGSFTGVTYYIDDDPAYGTVPGSTTITMSKTGIAEYVVRHEAGSYAAGVTAETATYPDYDGSGLWERNRNVALPVLKAWGLIQWVDRETTRQVDSPGPVLRHGLGAMARQVGAERVRDYLHDLILNALPQITGLEVTPDPRRQIGDTITVQSENFLGVTIRGKITGISEQLSADGYTQTLDLEPTSVTTGSLTYEEWEQAFPGTLTYTQWQNLRDATDTYDDFHADPLKGAN